MTVRSWVDDSIRKKDAGLLADALLYPLSVVYGFAVRTRALLYGLNVLPSYRLSRKVISVGNITVGGTGKTPVTIFLAEFFRKNGKKAAVLSRGYKGSARGVAIVSDGKEVLLSPAEAGDEPYLMATRLKGLPVVTCADRVKGGEFIIERFSPDVIILDDAFQHIRLKRDVNIALIDSAEGFGAGYLLPRGILREPVSALRRADFALVKGGPPKGREWEALQKYSVPCISFTYRASAFYDIETGEEFEVSAFAGKKAVPVCGIANPASFLDTLSGLGVKLARPLVFPDHHAYEEKELSAIEKAGAEAGLVLTTEKDGVKLKDALSGVKVYALRIDAVLEPGQFDNYLSPILRGVW
ncbi:tetraacyldisaccharide 4'-kinase [uncultured bacterium]|nr:tetraacyldisaccharide 4'-kinase [uncultured bacterium]